MEKGNKSDYCNENIKHVFLKFNIFLEIADSYRYLDVLLNDRLDWRTDNDPVCKKQMNFQCVHQNAGDLLPVFHSESCLLCCWVG